MISGTAWADPQARVSMTQAGFVSPDYMLTDRKDFQFVGAGLDTISAYRNEHDIDDSLQAQIHGLVSPGVSVLSYLNVTQIYWKQHMLTVGRKKLNWSTLDEKAMINGQMDQVRYTVQKPDTQDVIFNRSFGSRVFFGEEDRGLYFQGSYANKPSNQLALGFQGAVVPDNAVDVTILPAIYFHTLYGADSKYTFKYTSGYVALGVSGMQEKVQPPNYTSEWTYVTYSDSTLVSPYAEMTYSGFKARISHLSVDGSESSATGSLAKQSSSVLPARLPFRGASQVRLEWLKPLKRHQALHFSTRYLTGDQSEFELLSFRGAYQWEERWSGYVISQMINVQNNPEGRAITFFPYVNNDGVAAGVQYVF